MQTTRSKTLRLGLVEGLLILTKERPSRSYMSMPSSVKDRLFTLQVRWNITGTSFVMGRVWQDTPSACKWDSFWLFSVLRKSFSTPPRKFVPGSRSILPDSVSRWWLLMSARSTESFGDGISRGRISDSYRFEFI